VTPPAPPERFAPRLAALGAVAAALGLEGALGLSGPLAGATSPLRLSLVLGGAAAGLLAGTRLAASGTVALRLVALAHAASALCVAAAPALLTRLGPPAVALVPGAAALAAFGMLLLVPPAGRSRLVPMIVAAAALGAALGVLVTSVVVLPALGFRGATTAGAALHLVVAVLALRSGPGSEEGEAPGAPLPAGAALVLGLSLTCGSLVLGLAATGAHLLALSAGGTAPALAWAAAFALLGAAAGARSAAPAAGKGASSVGAAGIVGSAGLVLATIPAWTRVDETFLLLARGPLAPDAVPALRALVAAALVSLPVAGLAGALTLLASGPAAPTGRRRQAGAVAVTASLGALAASLLVPRAIAEAGGLETLRHLAVALAATGGGAALALARGRARAALVAAGLALAGLALATPPEPSAGLDPACGLHLRRSPGAGAPVLFEREETTGRLTRVAAAGDLKSLVSGGALLGDDGGEAADLGRLAAIPVLLGRPRGRALVVGLGTGAVAAALAGHGFEPVVCAEPSAAVIDAARAHFLREEAKGLPLEIVPEDGRTILRRREDLYDVVIAGTATPWAAGSGGSQGEGFHRLVARRLAPGGVLVEWLPLHHLPARGLHLAVSTARAAFPRVSVFTRRRLVAIVSGHEPHAADLAAARAFAGRGAVASRLRSGSLLELLGDLAVTDSDADSFLEALGELVLARRGLVSSDAWPGGEILATRHLLDSFLQVQNRETLRRLRSRDALPLAGRPTAAERAFAAAAFLRGWRDPGALPAIVRLWREEAALTQIASAWLLEELSDGEEAVSARPAADALRELGEAGAAAALPATCEGAPDFVIDPRAPARRVASSAGRTLAPSRPEAAVDDRASPEWGQGWRVRPEGEPARLEIAFDRPHGVSAVHVVARPVDGSLVFVRLLGQDAGGRWRPLAADGAGEGACRGARVYRLPARPTLAGLCVELRGESAADRLALHEVWAVSDR
jgi:spermidine synthase